MERTKFHIQNGQQLKPSLNYGSRVFGQELTNLNDIIRHNRDVNEITKQKSSQQILSSRVNINYISHAAIMNDIKERERLTHRDQTQNERSTNRSTERLSKSRNLIRNDQFDSNHVWHHVKIEPIATNPSQKDKSLIKERTQSLHQQQRQKNTSTSQNIPTQYSVLKNVVRDQRQRSQNHTVHLNLSNLSLTYKLQNAPSAQPYTTVRFNDLKTVMDSMDQKLSYNSESIIETLDKQYSRRPEHVSLYAQDSFTYLTQIQNNYMPDPKLFGRQVDVNKKMRSILLDWIVDVQCKFKMRDETFHLTVNLLDRFLSKVQIPRSSLQLMGVGAMLIASKIEEVYAPQIRDLSYITEHAYSKQDIIQAESQILTSLDFQLNAPTVYSFMCRYQMLAPMQTKHLYLALFVVDLLMIQTPQEQLSNHLAAGAFYLVRKIKRYEPSWPKELSLSSEQDESEARSTAKTLCIALQTSQSLKSPSYFEAVIKKYSSSRYLKVAQLRIGKQSQQATTTSTMVHDTEVNEP